MTRRDLVDKPWSAMNLSERVRYLLGASCSANEVAAVTGLPAAEIQRLKDDRFPQRPTFSPGGKRGFHPPFNR